MSTTSLTRRKLLQTLHDKVIPWAMEDTAPPILAWPPAGPSPEEPFTLHRGQPLSDSAGGRSHLHLHRWPETRVHALRCAFLGCVIRGEADLRVGITQSMAAKQKGRYANSDYQVVTVCERDFLLVPPGVPFSDGSSPHWERKQPHLGNTLIFWLQILPTGTFTHLCMMEDMEHTGQPSLFIRDPRMNVLNELLIDELTTRAHGHEQASRSLLVAMLLRFERGLRTDEALAPLEGMEGNALAAHDNAVQEANKAIGADAVRQACAYIDEHLREPLTLDAVAAHAYVSPTHLNRLFRAELGTSVMKFMTQRRIEVGRALLTASALPIREVARQVGYRHASHFTQVFTRATGQPPQDYRKTQRGSATEI